MVFYTKSKVEAKPKSQLRDNLITKDMWDSEFESENPSDQDKSSSIWGDSTLDPWTGRPTDDDSDE